MNKMERIKLGRGSTTTMGLAGMHCVRRCMCVFMLKSCDSVGIWWQMCAGIGTNDWLALANGIRMDD
jgi:hypothetical protein